MIVDPDNCLSRDPKCDHVEPAIGPEVVSWENLTSAFSGPEVVPSFSNGQMIEYFVTRTVSDGLPAGDFKSMNKRAKGRFDCGHVQNIQINISSSHVLLRASCLPEMKKDTVYKVRMSLESSSYTIVGAVCGCKAGQGPKASCKHVGALCYAFAKFCRFGKLPEFISSTEKLQEWNQPRSRRVEVIQAIDLSSRRQEILKKDASTRSPVPEFCRFGKLPEFISSTEKLQE